MDEDKPKVVHCLDCSKYVILPEGSGAGSKLKCPFCFAEFMVEEKTVLVPRPITKDPSQD